VVSESPNIDVIDDEIQSYTQDEENSKTIDFVLREAWLSSAEDKSRSHHDYESRDNSQAE
jgi:hypothetical protein